MNNFTFDSSKQAILTTTTPRIEFTDRVPSHFIEQFLRYMGKGNIRITDYQGNELKVYYEYGTTY